MIFGKHINKYYLKYGWMLLLGTIALIAVDYFQLKVPELYQMLINGINEGAVNVDGVLVPFNMEFLLNEICVPLFIVIAIMVTGRFAWRVCFFIASVKVETEIRGKMFLRCKDLSLQFYQVNKVGNLMSYFTNDLETIEECFGWGIMMFLDALFLGVMSIIKMFRMDPLLAGLSLIPMAFMATIGAIVGKYMTKKWDERQKAFSDLSDFSQESFSGIAVIKAFVKELKELSAFRRLNKNNEDANVAYTKASTLLNIFITLFIESVTCIILGYGGYLVYEGTFNAGQLMEFIGYFNAIIWPVMAISELIEMTARGKASLDRVSGLLDAKTDVFDSSEAVDSGILNGEIEFRNLTFAYPGSEINALENVSFKINAGESVGITGRTGAGKTTIVDLILRTYNVPDGTVFLDGKDVNALTIRSVRDNCAYVPQDNFLFSDTIAKNIGFAFDTPDREQAEANAKLADVHDNIVEFHDGYDTVLGERGVTVSGGQKQRISIARALMKNSPILILDDSVSAVDTKTERKILDNLSATRKGKTTILIAHRVSTIENMDKIIYVEDGKISDIGTYDELYERCKAFRNTVDLQKLEDEKEAHNA